MSSDQRRNGSVPFIIRRTVNAPGQTVWNAWTRREELQTWFGATGCSIPTMSLDLRPGGICHYSMRTPDGHVMWENGPSARSSRPNVWCSSNPSQTNTAESPPTL